MSDRISELPDDLLHNILFLVPKEEAARTSFLSRRWRSLLSSFPVMIFDQPAFERDENVFSENIKKMERDFCDLVDRVIHRRRECSVQTLKITIWNGKMAQEKVSEWIAYAMERNLKHLVLHLYNRETTTQNVCHYPLPCCFWKHLGLRTIELQGCHFSDLGLSLSSGFGLSLTKISLVHVKIDDRVFHNMISSCPVLEDLAIKSCTGFQTLNVVGSGRIHKVDLKLMRCESQIILIKVQGVEVLSFDGNPYKLTETIQNSLLEFIREISLVNIQLAYIPIPHFPLLEKLELNNCRLFLTLCVSSDRLKSFELTECQNVQHLVLDTLCLKRFRFKGHDKLDVIWINSSGQVEIDLALGPLGHFSHISFSKVAKFLLQLRFCKVLTIVCDESNWIAPRRISLERGFTIEHLNMKIMRRYPQERPFMTVMADFMQMSQRPVAVSAEVGEGNTVDHVKLHFLYQHEIYGCGRSRCGWRSCLEELRVSQSSLQQHD